MADRITARDCAATLARIVTALDDEAPDVRQLFISHESGVWRLRWHALEPGSWVSDIGPGHGTACELDNYLRGILDGLGLTVTIRHHVEADVRWLKRRQNPDGGMSYVRGMD